MCHNSIGFKTLDVAHDGGVGGIQSLEQRDEPPDSVLGCRRSHDGSVFDFVG